MNAKVKALLSPLAISAEDHAWLLEASGFWRFMREQKIAWLKEHHSMDCSEMSDDEIEIVARNMLAEIEDLQTRLNAIDDENLYRWQVEEAQQWNHG